MNSDALREAERVLNSVLSSGCIPCYNRKVEKDTTAGIVVGKYTTSVNIRLKAEDAAELQRRADRRGVPLSVYLRMKIKLDILEKPDTEPTNKS